jgi:MtN3 and saliva related transmembrane protein
MTTVAAIPQVARAYKTHSTDDLSYASLICIDTGVAMWAIYGGLVNDIPLLIYDVISFILYSVLIVMKLKYDKDKLKHLNVEAQQLMQVQISSLESQVKNETAHVLQ